MGADGSFTSSTAFSTPFLPTDIAAADLTGDGLDDIIVANSLNDSVSVAFQSRPGQFASPITLPVGMPHRILLWSMSTATASWTSWSATRPAAT